MGIGSIDGMGGQAGRIAYSASKWAVHGLLKGLAMEWGRYNVEVNGIAPTWSIRRCCETRFPPTSSRRS